MNPLWFFLPFACAAIGLVVHFIEHAMGWYAARKYPEQNTLINASVGMVAGILILLVVIALATEGTTQ